MEVIVLKDFRMLWPFLFTQKEFPLFTMEVNKDMVVVMIPTIEKHSGPIWIKEAKCMCLLKNVSQLESHTKLGKVLMLKDM